MKWSWFLGACLIAAWITVSLGAPLVTVVAGIALAAAWNVFKKRSQGKIL
jgi:hypothetical protein